MNSKVAIVDMEFKVVPYIALSLVLSQPKGMASAERRIMNGLKDWTRTRGID